MIHYTHKEARSLIDAMMVKGLKVTLPTGVTIIRLDNGDFQVVNGRWSHRFNGGVKPLRTEIQTTPDYYRHTVIFLDDGYEKIEIATTGDNFQCRVLTNA